MSAFSGLTPWMVVALAVHSSIIAVRPRPLDHAPPSAPPFEMELTPVPESPSTPEPPRPTDPPPTEEAHETPASVAPHTPQATSARAAPPAEAARAANLLTAGEAATADEPASFITDPNGAAYGFGSVARGGTADHADSTPRDPAPAPPAPPKPRGDTVTPAAELQRAAKLEASDPCRGYFPAHAAVDSGVATLAVVVRANGGVARASVLSESPPGEGFGPAAHACLVATRFTPALDLDGNPTMAAATVRIRFSR